jgi:hypothetical protein
MRADRGAFPVALEAFSFVVALVLLVAGGGAFAALRTRHRAAALAVAVATVVLLALCFLPTPRHHEVGRLVATGSGHAWVPVEAGVEARVDATGGNVSIERAANGTWIVLDCPRNCSFSGGTFDDAPAASLRVDRARLNGTTVDGGELRISETVTDCERFPVVIALSFSTTTCMPCHAALVDTGADGQLRAGPLVTVCVT